MISWVLMAAAFAATVEGRVLEHGNAAPLPGAVLTTADGTQIPLDETARFSVELPDGVETHLVVSTPDHRLLEVVVVPPLDKPLRLFLEPLDGPGEIVVEAFRPTADLTRHTVDAEMAYETPGTYDDAVRLVQALPGVNVQREFSPSSGDMSVRGSLPGDNRYYYDGIEVPYLYHFNQYASVFPASQLDSLELYSSTFGVRYGDSVGAVIEANSDTTRPEDVTGHASINFVTAGVGVKVPLPKKWWMAASARRSFQDLVEGATDQYTVFPRFYDFSVRAEHQPKPGVSTGIFTAGAGDRYDRFIGELDVLDPVEDAAAPNLTYGRDYQLLGVRHTWRRGRFVTALMHDHLRADVSTGGQQDQRTLSLPTRVDASGPVIEKLRWEAGAEVRPQVTWLDLAPPDVAGILVSREAPAMAWGESVDRRFFRLRAGTYGGLHALLGPVQILPGIRVGLDSAGWKPLIEPRLAARFRLADQTEIRLAGGRYQQRTETAQQIVFPDLPTTTAWQVGIGVDQTVAGRLEFAAEGYLKLLDNVIVQPADGAPLVFDRGQAYGAELTVRYRMRETFFLWAWFAYGRSLAIDAAGERVPTSADQPFSGGVVASWNITSRLNMAVRYRLASGNPYTGIDGSVYDATADTWLPRLAALNAERLPFYQKIDLHAAYTIPFPRWSLALSVDLWIVPKSSAQLYPTWNYDYTEQGFVIGPTVLPLLGARATF